MRSGGFVSQGDEGCFTFELDREWREMKVSHRRGCEGELKVGYLVVLVQRDGRLEANEEKNLLKPFEGLFLRSPNSEKREGHVVIEIEEMKSIAERLWVVELDDSEMFDDGDP